MQHIAQMLPTLLPRLRHIPALNTSVWRALWTANVGSAMSAHTSVSRYEKGVLIVQVDHLAWHQQLLRMRQDLISALNRACGRTVLMDVEFIYRDTEPSQSEISNVGRCT